MSDEKDVVPESNGKEQTENGTNEKEATVEKLDVNKPEDNDAHDLDAEIIRQVEHYFGDVNLPRDKFLLDQTKLDDGWVPLKILTTFKRLSKLSSDIDVIEKALKKSTSGLLEVADKKVRRNPERPVPEMNEDHRKELLSRTIYAKGFPKTLELDDALKFFKKYDHVVNVIMRRYIDPRTKRRLFKGSVFATFKTREQAEQFIAAKDTVKYNDSDLLIMFQDEYIVQKEQEKKGRPTKKEKKQKQKQKEMEMETQDEIPEKRDPELPTGTVLYFEDGHEKMTREEIKEAFTKIDNKLEIAFIDFKIGLTKGWVRFVQENGGVDFLASLGNGSIEIGDHKVFLKLLEGDEEKAYLQKTIDQMVKRRKIQKTFKKSKNTYKGKNFLKRKREVDNDDSPPTKVKCDS